MLVEIMLSNNVFYTITWVTPETKINQRLSNKIICGHTLMCDQHISIGMFPSEKQSFNNREKISCLKWSVICILRKILPK